MSGALAPGGSLPPSFALRPEGLRVLVRLTPRAATDAIEGTAVLADGRAVLRARVRSVPEAGRANQALVALISRVADWPRSKIAIVEGETSRLKTVELRGASEAQAQRLRP